MNNEILSGVRRDPRPQEAQDKDFQHVSGAVIEWKEKSEWKKYTQRNQSNSGSCVFQSAAKAIEIMSGKIISATPYFWRKNYSEFGAFLQDAGDILYNRFTTTEALSKSQYQGEKEMNTLKPLTTQIGITGYRTIYKPNIDKIAEAIEQYGHCIITIGTNNEEYTSMPVSNGKNATFYHAVCGVDYGIKNGKKVIRIEDSAGQHSAPDGIRYFTEDFITQRITGAIYFLGVKDLTIPQDNTAQKISIIEKLLESYKKLLAILQKRS